MSTIKKDSALSGMLSSAVTVRKVGGQVVVTNRRKQRPQSTDKQTAVQSRFLEATQYANRQVSQPDSNALYASGMTSKKRSAYIVAMSDYLSAPKVESINATEYLGNTGDTIVVKAVDDFMVTKVRVIIINAAGAVIEQGDAGPDADKINLWAYKATVANPTLTGTTIKAIAYDRPGNAGVLAVQV